jgi:hypothetical protein
MSMKLMGYRVTEAEREMLLAMSGDKPLAAYVRKKLGLPPITAGRPKGSKDGKIRWASL